MATETLSRYKIIAALRKHLDALPELSPHFALGVSGYLVAEDVMALIQQGKLVVMSSAMAKAILTELES